MERTVSTLALASMGMADIRGSILRPRTWECGLSRLLVILALIGVVAGACAGSEFEDTEPELTTGTTQLSTTAGPTTTTTGTTPITSTTTVSSTTTRIVSTTAPPTTADQAGVIAFNRDGELWLMDANGTDAYALVTSVAVTGRPSWSPDGTRLAFTGFEPGPSIVLDIWIVNIDSSGLTNLTHGSGGDIFSASWSPDGSQIVFAGSDRDLWIMDVDGGERTRITQDATHQSNPAWAPDGSLIAYCSLPVTAGLLGSDDIWVIEPDGSNPQQLTDTGDACLPAWSPDSAQIAFTAWVFAPDFSGDQSDVWIMNRDGSGQRNVTNDPTRFDSAPAWSSDGSTIAFHSGGPLRGRQDPVLGEVIEHDPPLDIYLMHVAGGPKKRLTTGEESDGGPAWQPLP